MIETLEGRQLLSASVVVNSSAGAANYAANVTISQLNPSVTPVTLQDAVNAVDNTPGAATITFDPIVFPAGQLTTITPNGTLELSNTSGQITIQGPGSGQLAVSGNDQHTVFLIDSSVTGEIDNVMITGGHATIVTPGSTALAGGGLYNNGTLSLSNDLISQNVAVGSNPKFGEGAGVYNAGRLTVTNCVVSGNLASGDINSAGGGFDNLGTLVVTASTISGDSAGAGGGIMNFGTATISSSTLSGNSALSGGGPTFSQFGGGIANFGAVTVTNCTVTANFAANNSGGGLFNDSEGPTSGEATIIDSTIAGNFAQSGGGIEFAPRGQSGFVKLFGTIVAANTMSSTDSTPSDYSGTSADASSSHDLVGQGDNSGLKNGQNGNIVGTAGSPVNARLAALGSNGGPTETMALFPNSPARGAGADFNDPNGHPITVDQRGVARVAGSVDIGAYQTSAPTITDITRVNPTAQATNASGVTFGITFDIPVQGVDAADFTVNAGTVGNVTQMNPTTYTVAVNGLGSFNGTLTLGIAPGQTITDLTGFALVNTTPTGVNDNFYFIDHNAPASTALGGEYAVSTSGGPATLGSITQMGTALTVSTGSTSTSGTVTTSTTLNAGGSTAIYGDSVITFGATGNFANQVWTKLDLPVDYWQVQGNAAHVTTNGNSITFMDPEDGSSPAVWTSPTTLHLTTFNLDVTVGAGKLTGSNGEVWYENVSLNGTLNGSGTVNISAVPHDPTVYDYTNGNGATVHAIGDGTTTCVFIDSLGRMSLGNFFNDTQATDNIYPGDVATFTDNSVAWTDGTVWTMTSSPPSRVTITDYSNPNGISTFAIENGTGNVAFADSRGRFTLGAFINATQADDTAYPNDAAIFTASGVTWQDGTVWANAAGPTITTTATDANGVQSHLQVINTTTLVGLDGSLAGVTGTRLNGKIFWSNGQIWVGFDHDQLNAFFEMGVATYP